MSKPFAFDVIHTYLRAVGIESDCIVNTINDDVLKTVNTYLTQVAEEIGSRLLDMDTNCQEDHKRRRNIYNSICNYFFKYAYCRYWEFKLELSDPPTSKNIDADLFDSNLNLSHVLISIFPEHFEVVDIDFLAHLDIQVRQWIYVHCYEHGLNFHFF